MVITIVRRSVLASVMFLLILGIGYPLVETAIAQATMPYHASGSLQGNGSSLIGQKWTGANWFHGRPGSYNPLATGASNLGPRSIVLEQHVKARIAAWHKVGVKPVSQLVTSSASGVDPDISPASAYAQIPMVADSRHLSQVVLRRLVSSQVHPPQLGVFGAPYVNVLSLNTALAHMR